MKKEEEIAFQVPEDIDINSLITTEDEKKYAQELEFLLDAIPHYPKEILLELLVACNGVTDTVLSHLNF